jgi:hypothetical protein
MSAMSRFARQACGYPLAHGARARTVQRRGSRRRQDRFHCRDLAIAFLAVRPSETAIVRSRVFSAATGTASFVFWHHLGVVTRRCERGADQWRATLFRYDFATASRNKSDLCELEPVREIGRALNFKSSELNSDRR